MLRAGWVTTYEQSGAEYDTSVGGKDTYVKLENEAKYVIVLCLLLAIC